MSSIQTGSCWIIITLETPVTLNWKVSWEIKVNEQWGKERRWRTVRWSGHVDKITTEETVYSAYRSEMRGNRPSGTLKERRPDRLKENLMDSSLNWRSGNGRVQTETGGGLFAVTIPFWGRRIHLTDRLKVTSHEGHSCQLLSGYVDHWATWAARSRYLVEINPFSIPPNRDCCCLLSKLINSERLGGKCLL